MKLYYNDEDDGGVLVWIDKNEAKTLLEIASFASEMVKSRTAWKKIVAEIEEFPLPEKQYLDAFRVGREKAQPFLKASQGVKTAVTKALKNRGWEVERKAQNEIANLQRRVYELEQQIEAGQA